MIKKISILLISFVVIIFTTNLSFADGRQPPPPSKKSKNFSKSKFAKGSKWDNNSGAPDRTLGPPGPGGGTGGNPIPISSGLSFLLIGSAIYFGKKLHDENR